MNMPPRPSQMHLNQDAMHLRQPAGTPDMHQGGMLVQQMNQDVRAKAEDRVPQQTVAFAEDMRGQQMNYDSQIAHADALALNTKASVLHALGMKGVPLDGMRNIQATAAQMGIA
jgi:hypothetical protein